MAEIEEEVTFEVHQDQSRLTTRTNGDSLLLNPLKLTQEQATSLAWLINSGNTIEFQVKVKT
jgi:hypothetical protein